MEGLREEALGTMADLGVCEALCGLVDCPQVGWDLFWHNGTLAAPADHDPVVEVEVEQVHLLRRLVGWQAGSSIMNIRKRQFKCTHRKLEISGRTKRIMQREQQWAAAAAATTTRQ